MIRLEIQRQVPVLKVIADADIERWVRLALQNRREDVELTVRIVDSEEMTALNRNYRNIDKTTNVLSFAADLSLDDGLTYLGDIAVCAEVVAAEARAQNKPLQAHWSHIVMHGVLHLLGYDHQTDEQAKHMESLEVDLLASLGFSNPYTVASDALS